MLERGDIEKMNIDVWNQASAVTQTKWCLQLEKIMKEYNCSFNYECPTLFTIDHLNNIQTVDESVMLIRQRRKPFLDWFTRTFPMKDDVYDIYKDWKGGKLTEIQSHV